MEWTVNKVLAVCIALLTVGIVTIIYFTPQGTLTPICYNGYRYHVDASGVMWPAQVKGIVQKCHAGDHRASK